MPEKTGTMKLNKSEADLIAAIRAMHMKHGRIPCVIYFQDGQMTRVVFKGEEKSVKLG